MEACDFKSAPRRRCAVTRRALPDWDAAGPALLTAVTVMNGRLFVRMAYIMASLSLYPAG